MRGPGARDLPGAGRGAGGGHAAVRRPFLRAAAAAALLAAAACATGPPPGELAPVSLAIPEVRGPLELYVAYPDSGDAIAVSDSNFIFGTTGTGAAELTVDGHPVDVEPNGSFLAWLPVPERSAGDTARYRLVARSGGEADTVMHPVILPPEPYRGEGRVWLDTTSAGAFGERWSLPGEEVELTVSGAPGLEGWVTVGVGGRPPGETERAAEDSPGGGEDASGADGAAAADSAGTGGGTASPSRLPLEEQAPGRYRLGVPAGRLAAAALAGRRAGRRGPPPEAGAAGRAHASGGRGGRREPARPGALRPGGPVDTLTLRFAVTDGRDTARAAGRMAFRLLDPRRLPVTALREAPDPVHGRSGSVVGRPAPYASYAWVFPDRSRAVADRRRGDRIRLRLSAGLEAWVAAEDAEELPGAAAEGRSLRGAVGTVRASGTCHGVRVEIPVRRRLPADVRREGPSGVALTLHGGLGATERMLYGTGHGGAGPALSWEQLPGPRYRLEVQMEHRVWGWRLRWRPPGAEGALGAPPGRGCGNLEEEVGARGTGPRPGGGTGMRDTLPGPAFPDSVWNAPGGTLVLEVRRPPAVDEDRPLEGIRVAVDAGHPPVGAEGPTGLTEADANLAVARELEAMLRAAGADPFMVRDDSAAVGLYERRRRARAAGADLLVSIHNNALPDGLRPFGREGTSVYYFHPHAVELARSVQRHLLGEMGLRDLGVRWGNLALPREPWMPSVLTEGAFMMIPAHEAALRRADFRRAYARGVLEGIRAFLGAWGVPEGEPGG